MIQADRMLSMPPTNTSALDHPMMFPPRDPTRRRFLTVAVGAGTLGGPSSRLAASRWSRAPPGTNSEKRDRRQCRQRGSGCNQMQELSTTARYHDDAPCERRGTPLRLRIKEGRPPIAPVPPLTMVGISACPAGSSGKRLHQPCEQAEGATLMFCCSA